MNIYHDGNILYKIFRTSEITEDMKKQYIEVHKEVFNSSFGESEFRRKFEENIYGDSIHVIVYKENIPCAIRSLWRNDCNDMICYQPCDTGVLSAARGGGIFAKMTNFALDYIDSKEYLIYNFPNKNSRRLYLKNGWRVCNISYVSPFLSNQRYEKCSDRPIPDEYAEWYFSGCDPQLFVRKIGKVYYLVKLKGRFACIIIGQISEHLAKSGIFKKSPWKVTFFRTVKSSMLKLRPLYVVTTSDSDNYFDSWRIDAI